MNPDLFQETGIETERDQKAQGIRDRDQDLDQDPPVIQETKRKEIFHKMDQSKFHFKFSQAS